MTSKLLIAIAAFAIIVPFSAQAQQYKFSNERDNGKSEYVTEWKDVSPQLKRQMPKPATGTSPTALNNTAPASGGAYVSEMHVGRGIKRAQTVPTNSYNQ